MATLLDVAEKLKVIIENKETCLQQVTALSTASLRNLKRVLGEMGFRENEEGENEGSPTAISPERVTEQLIKAMEDENNFVQKLIRLEGNCLLLLSEVIDEIENQSYERNTEENIFVEEEEDTLEEDSLEGDTLEEDQEEAMEDVLAEEGSLGEEEGEVDDIVSQLQKLKAEVDGSMGSLQNQLYQEIKVAGEKTRKELGKLKKRITMLEVSFKRRAEKKYDCGGVRSHHMSKHPVLFCAEASCYDLQVSYWTPLTVPLIKIKGNQFRDGVFQAAVAGVYKLFFASQGSIGFRIEIERQDAGLWKVLYVGGFNEISCIVKMDQWEKVGIICTVTYYQSVNPENCILSCTGYCVL